MPVTQNVRAFVCEHYVIMVMQPKSKEPSLRGKKKTQNKKLELLFVVNTGSSAHVATSHSIEENSLFVVKNAKSRLPND